jgi:hypothetical protein
VRFWLLRSIFLMVHGSAPSAFGLFTELHTRSRPGYYPQITNNKKQTSQLIKQQGTTRMCCLQCLSSSHAPVFMKVQDRQIKATSVFFLAGLLFIVPLIFKSASEKPTISLPQFC